jgi:hypothetical protein
MAPGTAPRLLVVVSIATAMDDSRGVGPPAGTAAAGSASEFAVGTETGVQVGDGLRARCQGSAVGVSLMPRRASVRSPTVIGFLARRGRHTQPRCELAANTWRPTKPDLTRTPRPGDRRAAARCLGRCRGARRAPLQTAPGDVFDDAAGRNAPLALPTARIGAAGLTEGRGLRQGRAHATLPTSSSTPSCGRAVDALAPIGVPESRSRSHVRTRSLSPRALVRRAR